MSTPHVMIQFSDDGGFTWSHEVLKPLVGPEKNYLNRVVLRRQGVSYDRRYRLTYSENTNFTLVSASARVSLGV
jgi:hypothetical protein